LRRFALDDRNACTPPTATATNRRTDPASRLSGAQLDQSNPSKKIFFRSLRSLIATKQN
jgi:hypothetical protein